MPGLRCILPPAIPVVAGVDTHKREHVCALVDERGGLIATAAFPVRSAGYRALLAWISRHGRLQRVGVKSTGSYGAGLTRHLQKEGVEVLEIDRPNRRDRRRRGKSDPLDAISAARAALAPDKSVVPKHRDGRVEALRQLVGARRSAVKARRAALVGLKAALVATPDVLRAELDRLTTAALIRRCVSSRPSPQVEEPLAGAPIALRSIARRVQALEREIAELDALIRPLVGQINSRLTSACGIGIHNAAQLLITAGDNPQRLRSEGAFAMLCGAAPLPASSGATRRHRLNRGGDRAANSALALKARDHPVSQALPRPRALPGAP